MAISTRHVSIGRLPFSPKSKVKCFKLTNFFGLLLFLMLAGIQNLYAQQDFKFNYNFKAILDPAKVDLYKMDKANKSYVPRTTNFLKLHGTLKKMSEDRDTLFIRLWPNSNTYDSSKPQLLSENDNYEDFVIKITTYPTINGYKGISLPFTSAQLFALNLPLRLNLKDGTIGSEFINANISLSKIWGRTRIYKSEFVKPRSAFAGLGALVGLGGTKNSIDKEEVGVNYGFNVIGSVYKLNLVLAIGFESGLSKYGRTRPFVGFGFGFDLVSANSPGTEEK